MRTDTQERVELLHVKEAAAELGLHPVTVRRHIASGELRAVRLRRHGHVRVPREALAEFVRPYSQNENYEADDSLMDAHEDRPRSMTALTTDRPDIPAPGAQLPS